MACAGLFLAASVAVTAGSCAEPEATFYIGQALSATVTVDKTGGCALMCGTTPLSAPEVFVGIDCAGNAHPCAGTGSCFAIRSELAPSGTITRTEKRTILLTETEATLGGSSGKFAASGEIDPLLPGTLPQDTSLFLYYGNDQDFDALVKAGSLQGSVILHGRTTGNLDLVTPRYDFEAVAVGVDTCQK